MTATQSAIQSFLALPREALPSAAYVDDDDDDNSPWSQLRDYILPPDRQQQNHLGEEVLLSADRPEWAEGVIVVLA